MYKEHVAAEVSLAYAKPFMENSGSDFAMADYSHLLDMVAKMKDMPDAAKRNRYLGWIQACICIAAVGSEGYNADDVFSEMLNTNRALFR